MAVQRLIKKGETRRVCVTVPADMLYDLKELAEMTGFSVSQLIRLRLEVRGPIVAVPEVVTDELRAIHGLIESAISSGKFDPNALEAWGKRVKYYDRLVDFASYAKFVHAKKKRGVSHSEKAQYVADEERGATVC